MRGVVGEKANAGQMEQVSIVSDWRKAAPSKASKLLSFGESAMGQESCHKQKNLTQLQPKSEVGCRTTPL